MVAKWYYPEAEGRAFGRYRV